MAQTPPRRYEQLAVAAARAVDASSEPRNVSVQASVVPATETLIAIHAVGNQSLDANRADAKRKRRLPNGLS